LIYLSNQNLNTMKQLLLILSIALLTIGNAISQNRYSEDELTWHEGIIILISDETPITGIVYSEHENGQLEWEGNYKAGKKDGLFRYWYESGQLSEEENYKAGKKDGEHKQWYKNGQLSDKTNFKDGEKDGVNRSWYENGQLSEERNYKAGKKDGLWTGWHENGQSQYVKNYKDGVPTSVKEWDKNGNLTKDE